VFIVISAVNAYTGKSINCTPGSRSADHRPRREVERAKAERARWERRVALLKPTVSIGMLDERARQLLKTIRSRDLPSWSEHRNIAVRHRFRGRFRLSYGGNNQLSPEDVDRRSPE